MLENQTDRNVGAMLAPISQSLSKTELSPPPRCSGIRGADGPQSLLTDDPQAQSACRASWKEQEAPGAQVQNAWWVMEEAK